MMTQQEYSFRASDEAHIDDGWSCWYPLEGIHHFIREIDYRFRDKPVSLADGIYADLNERGLPRGAVWRRENGTWAWAKGGHWEPSILRDDADIIAAGYVRLGVAK